MYLLLGSMACYYLFFQEMAAVVRASFENESLYNAIFIKYVFLYW